MNERARSYGNKVAPRRPTRGAFGIKTTKTTLPPKKPEPEIVPAEKKPPTYAFVDTQRGDVDNTAEDKGKEDETIRESKGKAKESEEQATTSFKPPAHKVIKAEKSDQPSTETQTARATDDFEIYWSLETSYDIEEETYSVLNEWTPNCLGLFEILKQTGVFVYGSRIVQKHHPEYMDYAVACYYSVIFYVQILRAREAAGALTGLESTFLRRFRRKFNEEELPISGIVFPFFANIVSTLLADSKYNWIVPRIADGLFRANMADYNHDNGSVYLQPLIPHMVGILRFAFSRATKGHYFDLDAANEPIYFTDTDQFVPAKIGTTQKTIFGVPFTRGTADAAHPLSKMTIFSAAGVNYPFRADADTMALASKRWATSSFVDGLKVSAIAGQTGEGLITGAAVPTDDLEKFLCMPKSNNMEWFRELVNQAATHARFFSSVKNLSDVPVTGGNETLLIAEFRGEEATDANSRFGANRSTFASPQLQVDEDNYDWYPTTWENLKAGFYTTRNGLSRAEVLQGITFGVNATLPVIANTHRIGTEHGSAHVNGKYFENTEKTATMHEEVGTGKPMFRGWKTLHQTRTVQVKPQGY